MRRKFWPLPFLLLILLIGGASCKDQPVGKPGQIDTVEIPQPPQTPLSAFEWTCEREDSLQQVDTTLLSQALTDPQGIRAFAAAYLYDRYGGMGADFSCSREELAAFIQFKDWRLACVLVETVDEQRDYIEFRHRLGGSYEEMKLLKVDSQLLVLRSGVFCEGQCEYEFAIRTFQDSAYTNLTDSLAPSISWQDFMTEVPTVEQVERIEKSIQFGIGYSLPAEGATIRVWLSEEWEFGELSTSDSRYLDQAYNELDLNWENGKYVIGAKRRRVND